MDLNAIRLHALADGFFVLFEGGCCMSEGEMDLQAILKKAEQQTVFPDVPLDENLF